MNLRMAYCGQEILRVFQPKRYPFDSFARPELNLDFSPKQPLFNYFSRYDPDEGHPVLKSIYFRKKKPVKRCKRMDVQFIIRDLHYQTVVCPPDSR